MHTRILRRFSAAVFATLVFVFAGAAPATPVHILKVDLRPGIRAGASAPAQFAVLVPHKASSGSAGTWAVHAGQAIWEYSVAVPSAVSLSFHATRSNLPPGAMLVVRGARTTATYAAGALHRGELWSRIQPGEALQFTLTVPLAARSKVAFNIVSLQAGYRSLGPGVQDHPYYRQLQARAGAASGNATCVTNYECQVTSANSPPGQATAALIIGNLYQCTGTLINDVPGDNTPYVLTGRHCETGQLGGGNPGAAATVTVYWDAVTPCGTALGSIYDQDLPAQTGAQTVVEQQDAWLIELDANPVVADAQFAGFDASGGAVQGGYTIHHAEGYDKQFTGWSGQAYALQASDVLSSKYVSSFWETVNAVGNIAPGASGGGLFDQNNHLVGSLTLGRSTTDSSGYGACPVTPAPAPNGSNGVADFTSLAAVWNSTADSSSSTGTTTIKSVLDPANTGTEVVASAAVEFVSITASPESLSIGQPAILTWTAAGATGCTAADGVSGDGWSGSLPASGTRSVTESTANYVTYTLNCAYAGGRTAHTAVIISWLGPTPAVQFNGPTQVWTGAPAILTWSSNVTPCAISGGGVSLNNLAASGTTNVTQATASDVDYELTCGPANQATSYPITVSYVTPSLVFNANGTDRMIGVPFFLVWSTAATTCTPSGGAPNDGWTNTEFTGVSATSAEPVYLNVTTVGTYTYTLTCSAGPSTVQKSVTVTFENNPPYVTLNITPSTVTFTGTPADYATVTWTTNQAACGYGSSLGLSLQSDSDPYLSDGTEIAVPAASGTYQVTVYCFPTLATGTPTAQSAATLTVLPPAPPTAAISISPATVIAGEAFTVSWSSTNSYNCGMTGGIPGQGWGSSGSAFQFPTSGKQPETGVAGTYTFGLSCDSFDPNTPPVSTQATLTIGALSDTLKSSSTTLTTGQSFTLSWSSVGATGCTASGGGADGTPWTGNIAASGSVTQTASVAGSFTYTLVCGTSDAMAAAQNVSVTVSASTSGTGGGGSAGGGGGGALGLLELVLGTTLLIVRRRRAHRDESLSLRI
jgi:lysyl endopeptidase